MPITWMDSALTHHIIRLNQNEMILDDDLSGMKMFSEDEPRTFISYESD